MCSNQKKYAFVIEDIAMHSNMGPSIKYVTLQGGGVLESVTVCDRGRG